MAEVDAGKAPAGHSAGMLLRRAREAQGLHIAALAASLKVPVKKLEALERDRHDELPDATFTRALAQTVCRALKIDAAPVLALLPRAEGATLDHVASGINAPFRDKGAGSEPVLGGALRQPAFGIVALLAVGALALFFWPRQAPRPAEVVPPAAVVASAPQAVPEPVPAPPALPAEAAASAAVVETVFAAPPPASAASGAAAGILTVRTSEPSWIEVVDGVNRPLLSRTVLPGETVGLDGALPLKLKVGNAAATEIAFRGQPVDLIAATRENVARLELK
jgi:cytoskeleton protein RodZ